MPKNENYQEWFYIFFLIFSNLCLSCLAERLPKNIQKCSNNKVAQPWLPFVYYLNIFSKSWNCHIVNQKLTSFYSLFITQIIKKNFGWQTLLTVSVFAIVLTNYKILPLCTIQEFSLISLIVLKQFNFCKMTRSYQTSNCNRKSWINLVGYIMSY